MRRRSILAVLGLTLAAAFACTPAAIAQQPPIKIGMSMPQTGGLAAGGKAALIGIEMWRDDVNAKGGLLGRKVELIVYDDQSSAAETPGDLRQAARRRQGRPPDRALRHRADRADHAAGQAARPAADGQLLVPGEPQGQARQVVQQRALGRRLTAGPTASSRSAPRPAPRRSRSSPPTRSSRRTWPRPPRTSPTSARLPDRLRAELSAEHGRVLVDDPRAPRGQARHGVRRVLSARFGRHRARGERDRRRRQRQDLRRRHGRPAVRLESWSRWARC